MTKTFIDPKTGKDFDANSVAVMPSKGSAPIEYGWLTPLWVTSSSNEWLHYTKGKLSPDKIDKSATG